MAESGLEPWSLLTQNVVLKSVSQTHKSQFTNVQLPTPPLGLSQESDEGEGGVSEGHSGGPNNRNARQDFQNKTRVLSFGRTVQIFLPFMKWL